MDDNKPVLINEHEYGICKMVDELEEAFQMSCKHNNTTPSDLKYFRRYVFNLIVLVSGKK